MEIRRTVKVVNEQGLHARPCHSIVSAAQAFRSELRIRAGAREVNGKSILELMTLGAALGTELEIKVKGNDAEGLLEAISELFVAFGERVRYRISVDDPEDAVYDADRLLVQPYLGHDTHAHPLHRLHDFDGVFETLRDDGHGADADVFTVLAATYEDLGGAGPDGNPSLPPLTARAEVVLQPKRKQAEHASSSAGVRIEKTDDPAGGGQAIVFGADGAFVSFRPVNLHGIPEASLRLATAGSSGALELRAGAADGPLVGRAVLEPVSGLVLAPGAHEIRVEFFERSGGAGLHLRAADGRGPKRAIEPALLSHGPDHAPGLAVAYYELDPLATLPDYSTLEPYRRATVPTIDFPSTGDAFLGSGRRDNVGAVFTGFLTVEEEAAYAFFLESDDGARLFVDGTMIVDNDGLHGMVEKSAQLVWLLRRHLVLLAAVQPIPRQVPARSGHRGASGDRRVARRRRAGRHRGPLPQRDQRGQPRPVEARSRPTPASG